MVISDFYRKKSKSKIIAVNSEIIGIFWYFELMQILNGNKER